MADSKSAGRMAVWVRVPLRAQGRLGALTGSARKGPGPDLSVVNAHCLGAAVAKSPKVLRFFGEGRHVLFHVCGWCRRFVGAAR